MQTKVINLKPLSELYAERRETLYRTLDNLHYSQVDTDVKFDDLISSLTNHLTLTTVTIGEPKIVTHRAETKNEEPNFDNPFGEPRRNIIATVEFEFAGSRELFEYRGSGALRMGTIHTPGVRSITVEVTVLKLDKAEVIKKALDEMSITKELIRVNNEDAPRWNHIITEEVKTNLIKKRQELKDFYS